MPKKQKAQKKLCGKCGVEKPIYDFYATNSKMFPDGRVSICKTCLQEMIDINNVESLKDVLRQIDKPYIDYIWANALKTQNPVGNYLRQISSLPQYKNLTYKDSQETGADIKPQQQKNKASKEEDDIEISEELYKKWGREFSPIEILEFEDKYEQWINNYVVKTPMHEEFLKKAIIASVKMDKAIARGDSKEAEQYAKIFKEMTSAGKLQPNQMSRADLSEGLDTFGQLVRKVEEEVDIIPILPEYKAKPQDKGDFIIWQYINYIRHLQGLPLVDYKDVYEFYEKRKQEYAQRGHPEAEEW